MEPGRVQPLPGRHQHPSALGSGGQVPLQKELIVRKKEEKGLLCPFEDFFEKSPPGESAAADTEPPPLVSRNRPSPNQHFGDRFRPGKERRG